MKIYIWLSEENAKRLDELGLNYAKEVLGGIKRIEIEVNENIVRELLKIFPNAKVDTSTTNSIELLPKVFKDTILKIIIEERDEPFKALIKAIQRFKDNSLM